jgi:hypothetical protein
MALTTDIGGFRSGFDRLFNVSACFFSHLTRMALDMSYRFECYNCFFSRHLALLCVSSKHRQS